MADYYSLLARAVGNLPQSTSETRRAIYERARAALLGQLRGLAPPPPDADIARESAALDGAVARLEDEIAAKANAPAVAANRAAQGSPPANAASAAAKTVPAPGPLDLPPHSEKPDRAAPVSPNIPRAADEPAPSDGLEAEVGNAAGAAPTAAARRLAGPPRVAQRAKTGAATATWRLWSLASIVALAVAVVGTAAYVLPNPPFSRAGPKAAAPAAATVPDARPGKIGGRIEGGPVAGDRPAPVPDARAAPDTPAPQNAGTQVPASPQPAASAQAPAIGASSPAPDSNPPLPVAPRAALLVQTGEDTQNVKAFVGNVVWRIDTASGATGQVLQNSIRAEVDIPEARFKAVLVIQNNTDATLPASHTISIRFQPASDGLVGNVKAIDVPELREEGAQSGVRLIGTSLPITENNFLAALVRSDQALPRNLELLRTRAWIDVPMKMANNKLAKLTIEKGAAGDRVIAEALAGWEK